MQRDERPDEAETLFAELLRHGLQGLAARVDDLCRARPELAHELREMHADHRLAQGVRHELGLGPSVVEFVPLQHDETAPPASSSSQPPAATDERPFEKQALELGAEIGRGGMGQVLEAFDRNLGRTLALKRIRQDLLANEPRDPLRSHLVQRFLAEAQITAQLDHPGIVPVHELGMDEGGDPYYTMARIEGEDLGSVFVKARAGTDGWGLPRALELVVRVSETIAFAHGKGVVHRDLKPSNVRVGSLGQVYVTDWGLARVDGKGSANPSPVSTDRQRALDAGSPLATREGLVPGTPEYMAPEQAAGRASEVGPHTDVYALGALLYELYAGHAPYQRGSSTADELRHRVAKEPPAPLASIARTVPPEVVAIIDKAMSRDPRSRYGSALELALDLRAYLEGRVVRAHRVGAWVELRKWVARNRLAASATGAAILLALGGAITIALFSRAAERRARELAQFSDHERLTLLRVKADELWPIDPELIPEYDEWIAHATGLLARRGLHQQAAGDLSLSAEARERSTAILAGLDRLSDPGTGLLDGIDPDVGWGVRVRAEEAERMRERLSAVRTDPRWQEAVDSIAEHPPYGGLRLEPIPVLTPIGQDPLSGLWEFAHLASGEPPARAADGRLVLTEDSGIVFVLVPGGPSTMGAQRSDPDRPNFDGLAQPNESPLVEVVLAPYLLSKYELTRSQWSRWTGWDPSILGAGERPSDASGLQPVQTVSWNVCVKWLQRMGFDLPTEAQWEHAARAGTTTPWWYGEDPTAYPAALNIGDRAAIEAGVQSPGLDPQLDDGYAATAPVNALAPNPFGLMHVLGNVWEWCADPAGSYESPSREDDGLRLVANSSAADDSRLRVARGGCYAINPAFARASIRDLRPAGHLAPTLGVRPCLALNR